MEYHRISDRDRTTNGLIRKFYWVDTRYILADGLTKGGIDRLLEQVAIPHTKASIASSSPGHREVGFEHRNVGDLDGP